jgi:hypothetical protein
MLDKTIDSKFDLSKLWIALVVLLNLFFLLGNWVLKHREMTEFMLEHPIVILPYLLDTLGIVKALLVILIVIGFIPFIIALPTDNKKNKTQVIRGTEIITTDKLKQTMENICIQEIDEELCNAKKKIGKSTRKVLAKEIYQREEQHYIQIAGITIPRNLENRGFFFFGDPGTGKSQSIKQALNTLKGRPDVRGIIFDRNGEMLKQFYEPGKDVIYNPFDERSVDWCHTYEAPVRPETMAEALIPPPLAGAPNPFFQTAAGVVVGEIFRKTRTNQQVYSMLTKSDDEVRADLAGTIAARYLADVKLASSVVSTANNYCKFYRYVTKPKAQKMSFYNWAYNDDPRWIFVTLKENDAAVLKPLNSMLFELMLKGLLSNQHRKLKTAIIIDELGALNRLDSLGRLLSESRKFLGCPFLGTQTQAQITKIYGKEETSILLQGTLIKLMLRCSDPETADTMAKLIGKHEKLRYKTNHSKTAANFKTPASKTETTIQDYDETFAVLPSEIQNRIDLEGYLKVAHLVSNVQVTYVPFPDIHPDFIDADLDLTKY